MRGTTMPTRSESRPTPIAPRPLASSEIAFRLDAILDAVSRDARDAPRGAPRILAPCDLVRCLSPYTSRN